MHGDSDSWQDKHFSFFSHKECEHFPCHKTDDPDNFNCLFCYCPLYALGRDCGGNFTYSKSGKKVCTNCMIPHKRENFGYIRGRYSEVMERISALEAAAGGAGPKDELKDRPKDSDDPV